MSSGNEKFVIHGVKSMDEGSESQKVMRAFDKNANGYDNNSSLQYMQGLQVINFTVQKACQIVKNKSLKKIRIMDAGCGNGRTSVKLYSELRKELIKISSDIEIIFLGIDISPNMIQQSKSNTEMEGFSLRNINFYNKNIEELSEKDGEFDIAFSNSTLHWCSSMAYKKIYERLNFGGVLVAQQGGENCYKELHSKVWEAIDICDLSSYFYKWYIPVFYPSRERMENILHDIGFKDVSVKSRVYNDTNFDDLIAAFTNASLLFYLDRLPEENTRRELKDKFIELCRMNEGMDVTINRLNIIAAK